jgi:OmpA family
MRTLNNRDTRNSPIAFIITWLLLTFISMLLTLSLKAQDYQKASRKFNKSYYRKQTSLYLHACNLLERKRHKKPHKVNIAKSYRSNTKLSIKRVQKIRQLMLDMGVPDDRISVVGYGEELNKANNTTEEARQLNRRVDFTVF